MDFQTLKATYPVDNDYPSRTANIIALTKVIDGSMYDSLTSPFSEETNGIGEYIPLDQRRPSAKTRLCRIVVNDSVSLLFSEGHFPAVECADEATRDALTKIIKEAGLNQIMIDAATRGSVGSVFVLLQVINNRVFFKVFNTAYLTPTWDPEAPDTLAAVTELYKVKGKVLRTNGYFIKDDELEQNFWFRRVWDSQREIWYMPQSLEDAKKGKKPVEDAKRTTSHDLDFVPGVWIRNLPGGDDVDGAPTFPAEAVDTQIESDYLLSQGGRGLKYTADPTLHIKEPAFGENGEMVKGAANAIVTSQDGDAKLLEINGTGAAAVLEWVKGLREIAMEGMGGNRTNADKLASAQSGRAMELMNQTLIWLADKLRISYGEGALLSLLNMVVLAAQKYKLVDKKRNPYHKMSIIDDLSLMWPQWYAPTYADKQTQAQTLDTLRSAALISRETAVKSIAAGYDIADPQDEIRQIEADPPPPNVTPVASKQEPLSNSED